jgi:hypothetical protein
MIRSALSDDGWGFDVLGWVMSHAYDATRSVPLALAAVALGVALLLTPVARAQARAIVASALPEGEQGVGGGAGCLMLVVDLAAIATIYIFVRGLVPHGAHGAPAHVPTAAALAGELTHHGLRVEGVDLSHNALADGPLVARVMPAAASAAACGFCTVPAVRAATGQWIAPGAYAAFIPQIAAAVLLPLGVVLYLVVNQVFRALVLVEHARTGRAPRDRRQVSRDRAVRAQRDSGTPSYGLLRRDPSTVLRNASRKAERLDAKGDREQAADVRAASVETFVTSAAPGDVLPEADLVAREIARLVGRRPAAGMTLYDRACQRQPALARGDCQATILRARLQADGVTPLTADWGSLEPRFLKLLRADAPKATPLLADAFARVQPSRRSSDFSRYVAEALLAHLDAELRVAGADGGDAMRAGIAQLELLEQLDFDGRRLARGDALCALGDLASERRERAARHALAHALGSTAAGERTALAAVRDGIHLLVDGADSRRALTCFERAVAARPCGQYRFLVAVASVLEPGAAVATAVFDGVAERHGPHGSVALWRAIACVRAGDADGAAELLRSTSLDRAAPDVRAAARELVAVLEHDDAELAARADEALRDGRASWLAGGPIAPGATLDALARTRPDLLVALLVGVDDVARLPEWARVSGARSALDEALDRASSGDIAYAEERLALVERLIGAGS